VFNLKNQTILIISPHPDDEIYSAGGLIHKAKRLGSSVYVLFMTVGLTKDFSNSKNTTQDQRIEEIKKVAKYLKYDGWDIAFPGNDYHLQLDNVPQKKLIHAIERGKKISLEKIKPTMVLIPSITDYNQDHRATCEAAITALRPQPPIHKSFQKCVLSYEYTPSSWSTEENAPLPNVAIELSKMDMDAKIHALKLYKSQLKNQNGPLSVKAIDTLARLRGIQNGTRYAEMYHAKRIVS